MDTKFTKKEFFMAHVMNFNFELGADELISKGLERGFIVEAESGFYKYKDVAKHGEENRA